MNPFCRSAITSTTTNNALETAIAYPALLDPKQREYAYTTKVVDALFGPPPVRLKIRSKHCRELVTERNTARMMVGFSIGSVILKKL